MKMVTTKANEETAYARGMLDETDPLIAANQIFLITLQFNSSSECGFALSYTDHLFFVSSGLEHRLCSTKKL